MDTNKENTIINSPIFEALATSACDSFVFVADIANDLWRWSPNTVHYFNFESEYTGNPTTTGFWVEKIHPDDRDIYFEDINLLTSGKKDKHSCQYRVMNRYGEYIWLECNGAFVNDANGNPYVFAGTMNRLDNNNKYDSLTGLLTKNEIYNYDFDSDKGIIIMFGIDDFRRVINTYGYTYGDTILTELAKRISCLCKENQKFIRFNGDEFILLLPNESDDNDSVEEAFVCFSRIKEMMSNLEMKDGKIISLSISGGAEKYPIEGCLAHDYINHLEIAMDYMKRNNKGKMAFYSGDIELKQYRKLLLKRELKGSIDNGFAGFELYYQPWIDSTTNKVCGCESLLRWKGVNIKDAGPAEFIPILEEDEGIIKVGKWVMTEAMKQQGIWQEKYGDFKVSFNVSYRQFLEKGYVDEVARTAEELGVKTSNIFIELTESCDVENPDSLAIIFKELRDKGFKIALDDFGTGYASMELLKILPADDIKIDHKFVRELKKNKGYIDLAIIEAIMLLCSKMGCSVVVEGVENAEVDEIIKDMGPSYLQGYYYSKPINKVDFENKFEKNILCS